jgi:hypothetical protein
MKIGRVVLWQTFSMDLPFGKYENTILLYPDTVQRHGVFGGYAPLMTARNAFGVPVKFTAYSGENSYFTEQTAHDHGAYWEFPLKIANLWLQNDNTVWMPSIGFLDNEEIAKRAPIFAFKITQRFNRLLDEATVENI